MSSSEENKVIIDGQTYYGGLNQPNLKFVKVTVDCWEKIFGFLGLSDIVAMSQTCQRMRQIGGHYFRENFHGTEYNLDRTMCSLLSISHESVELERNDFLRFIDTMSFFNEMEMYEIITSKNLLTSLTTLKLWTYGLDEETLVDFGDNLNEVETFDSSDAFVYDNFVDQLLKSCPKLKSLRFQNLLYESSEQECGLFHRTFPMLVYFQFTECDETATISTFVERNPTIKCLHIKDKHLFNLPKNQLDCLKIVLEPQNIGSLELANRLKTLHANGGYKTLHLFIYTVSTNFDYEAFLKQMVSFSALKVLCVCQFYTSICQLTQLTELHLEKMDHEINLEPLAKNLQNLERLFFQGSVDQLLTFVRYSKSLKMVIYYDSEYPDNALNLFHFNQMRQLGGSKRKVRIGLYESKYLATKWKAEHLSCDLVEVTRAETIFELFDSCSTHFNAF